MGAFGVMLAGTAFFTYDPTKKNYFGSHYGKNINATQKLGMFIAMAGFGIIGLSWFSTAFAPAEGQTSAIYDFLSSFAKNANIYLPISMMVWEAEFYFIRTVHTVDIRKESKTTT